MINLIRINKPWMSRQKKIKHPHTYKENQITKQKTLKFPKEYSSNKQTFNRILSFLILFVLCSKWRFNLSDWGKSKTNQSIDWSIDHNFSLIINVQNWWWYIFCTCYLCGKQNYYFWLKISTTTNNKNNNNKNFIHSITQQNKMAKNNT